MNITKEKSDGFSILNINGRIDTVHSAALEKEVKELFDSGESNVILNCKGINYISSSGLRVFLIAQKRTLSVKGKLYLCDMQPAIQEIFRISGFWNLFKIFDTMEDALKE